MADLVQRLSRILVCCVTRSCDHDGEARVAFSHFPPAQRHTKHVQEVTLPNAAVAFSQGGLEKYRRSIEEARKGRLLTDLAFICAPLSFRAGVFGVKCTRDQRGGASTPAT